MSERRQHRRAHVLRRARIVFRQGNCTIDCVVLDLSAGGARLKFGGWLALPAVFEIHFDSGLARRAEICFRGVDTAGIRFTDEAA